MPSRVDTTNVRTPAVFVSEPVLGMAWVPVTPGAHLSANAELVMKAWCLYLNSTPGAISFLNSRSKKLTYPQYSLDYLERIPVPDPSNCEIEPMARAFDALCAKELQPWRHMDIDPVRCEIDRVVSEAIRLELDEIADWRNRIVIEPTVSNQKPDFDDH